MHAWGQIARMPADFSALAGAALRAISFSARGAGGQPIWARRSAGQGGMAPRVWYWLV
jgi:hypothetical protein